MPNDSIVEDLSGRLPSQFAKDLLIGAVKALEQTDNPARVLQFAATQRRLIDYVLAAMARDADVMKCGWFKQEKDRPGPTRRQRALYTCRGGLTDAFLKDRLGIDPDKLHAELSTVFKTLDEQTHLEEKKVLNDAEIEEFADNAMSVFVEVFETMDEMTGRISSALEKELHGEAMSAFINETIGELDILAGHYSTDIVWIEEAKVISLNADSIECEVTGSVDVTLLYGPKTDQAEIKDSFPYQCTTVAPASDPTNFDSSKTTMKVDTTSWFDDGETEEEKDGKEDY